MSKHCSNWSCDRPPTTKQQPCFAHFCDTYAMEAKERQAKGKEPVTLEGMIKELRPTKSN